MLVTTKVKMDLQKPGKSIRLEAVQNDCNTRCLEMTLCSGDVPWVIPEDAVAAMRYRKLDGTNGYYDTLPDGTRAWSIRDNVVSMMLAPQMTTNPGMVVAQLELMQGSKVLATGLILINVTENPGVDAVEPEDYVNWAQWMEERLQAYLQQAADSGAFAGPTGEPAVLVSSEVTYQAAHSGTEIPQGQWLETVPQVDTGDYLWTKTVLSFNSGEPVTQYSVCRSGSTGAGVWKISRVLTADNWSSAVPYVQSVTVDDLTDEENVRAYPEITGSTLEEKLALNEELGKIRWCTRNGNTVTFECLEEKPEVDISVILEVYV